MPNLGQGGCQAIEDALVITEKLTSISRRSEIQGALQDYRDTRLTRSAATQVRHAKVLPPYLSRVGSVGRCTACPTPRSLLLLPSKPAL